MWQSIQTFFTGTATAAGDILSAPGEILQGIQQTLRIIKICIFFLCAANIILLMGKIIQVLETLKKLFSTKSGKLVLVVFIAAAVFAWVKFIM